MPQALYGQAGGYLSGLPAVRTVWSHLAHWQLSSIDEIHCLLFSLLHTG